MTLWDSHARAALSVGEEVYLCGLSGKLWQGRPSYSLWGTGMLLTGEDSKHAL